MSGNAVVREHDLHQAGEVVCQRCQANLGIQRDGSTDRHPGRDCMGKQLVSVCNVHQQRPKLMTVIQGAVLP
ncbi:hypothetical protein D3C75_1364050 [compost metagenome]